MNENELSLSQAQKKVDEWISDFGVRYFSELTNLAILMEEVGEFARLVARKYGDQSFKKGEDPEGISKEIGDILFVLICLANQMGISLEDALCATLKKNTERDKDRHKENPKLRF
ncbi:nucleotide pyrophosphohydrolase [Leptospira borgpetersenii]|uniref:nucleotide pyrophosphohydrolase n=1 Tax=Leptospira borgpetersenii TaxID=174 RepID=UPI000774C9C6|nr:nucleotide pyrophosphohydrolase [Leptospira borgpetersenii]MBE8364936.1 nucleotide pyrophosphohydrolase [Leptospira borgpetersenii serovar Balcanica]MBE8367363.1 nucleotide pyrophosphohydrolase [Leptospira borgpetersenii serovar Balcanica]MBE8400174.1 nucleotide pyrophosphohydrolase [Leptospira borgpetersenii serovar Tarassovi]MBE8402575.1 nucleotide pyrophosphohydrolase [Leptospira borgpetersenii serovar Tarassovi]MBE8406552.1 nucleotide pyrophosphohydrolase [Leptospira borgpetersenii sero